MATWAQFCESEPALAQYGWDLLRAERGYAYLATLSTTGAPRVHPVVPFVAEGRMFIAIAGESPKVTDLRAKQRYMLHATVGDNDTEFALRGRATEAEAAVTARIAATQQLNEVPIRDQDVVFELDIARVDASIWDDGPARRQTWLAP